MEIHVAKRSVYFRRTHVKILGLFAHTYFIAILIVDEPSRLMTVEIRGGNDEIGHVERKETLTIVTARVTLWQHERLADIAPCIDMTEIRACEESVVTTGAEHQPT